MAKNNPRSKNGAARRNIRARFKAMGTVNCWLCNRPIDFSLDTYIDPKDGKKKKHPYSFELDDIVPVALGGDPFDINNLAPAHRICNQKRGQQTRAQLQHTKSNPSVTTPIPHYADL